MKSEKVQCDLGVSHFQERSGVTEVGSLYTSQKWIDEKYVCSIPCVCNSFRRILHSFQKIHEKLTETEKLFTSDST